MTKRTQPKRRTVARMNTGTRRHKSKRDYDRKIETYAREWGRIYANGQEE